jgi:hypothetical protein
VLFGGRHDRLHLLTRDVPEIQNDVGLRDHVEDFVQLRPYSIAIVDDGSEALAKCKTFQAILMSKASYSK